MKIAQIAPVWVPVPPRTHGGTELVVSLLTEELVARDHGVTLFASGDSSTAGKLTATCPRAIWRDPSLKNPHACLMSLMGRAAASASQFDIIHNHTGFYFAPFVPFIITPVVHTLHRPMDPEIVRLYKDLPMHLVAISHDQAESAKPLHITRVIYNGIPIERYPLSLEPKDYLLFLSRIAPDKGIIEAIEVARGAGKKLLIAGNIVRRKLAGEDDYEFFVRRVKPRIDGKQIVYLGEADFGKKIELLKNAKALLFPIRRREPFGLAPVEAMACGTPVIAFAAGATPEIIEDGKTGFLVRNINQMIKAVERIDLISRSACRERVKEKFTHARMVDEYERLYRDILRGAVPSPALPPIATDESHS